ncbi:MAG: alpha/beta fold hydrolase [Pirellulales bacterium]|nr:alpha/beta fold hydrolase [Pirellulales bacterium]
MRVVICRFALTIAGLLLGLQARGADADRPVRTLETPGGVRFGIWGDLPAAPSPTLFILANTIDGTLGGPYFRQAGQALGKQGYLCVSVDLPCHGEEHRSDEPRDLAGWRHRCEQGENFVEEANRRLSQVLDHLVAAGHTQATKVAVCGTSRGGFMALHFAASDARVKCVAAYAPVTDLAALREFHGAEANSLVKSLALIQVAEKLAGRAVWIVIGDCDERVGTDHAIALARGITKASLAKGLAGRVDLHVVAEPRGHTTPAGAAEQSAAWIHAQLDSSAATPQPQQSRSAEE